MPENRKIFRPTAARPTGPSPDDFATRAIDDIIPVMGFFGFGKKKNGQNGSGRRYPPVKVHVDLDGGFHVDPEEFFRHPLTIERLKQMRGMSKRIAAQQRAKREAGNP